MKKVLAILIISMFLISGVFAQNQYRESSRYTEQEMKEIQNRFENKYKFNCTGECTYYNDGETGNLRLEVKKQEKLFNRINITIKEDYVFNGDGSGEIIQARYNIWSRLLNRERIRI